MPIFHVGEDRGAPYIVMPFLKGQPLDQRLHGAEPMPVAEILRMGREVARALEAAHKSGLIHRDIKPANIWLEGPEERVKILDFGLARATSQAAGLTQQGAIVGTPSYMSPEQARGETVDARCDLWSLGVVLYRMGTGQQPFVGKDAVSTLMAVAMNKPAAPIQINSALPPELSELVMKLLEKDLDKRVKTAAEVVQSLQAIEKELIRKKEAKENTVAIAVPIIPKPSVDQYLFAVEAPSLVVGVKAAHETAPSLPIALPPLTGRKRGTLLAVALAAFFGLLILFGIYYWQTNNGVVRIEINDPEIKVSFDQDGPTITGADQKDIKLRAGEYGLHVERGDLKFDTNQFILKRGETVTVKIEWFKGIDGEGWQALLDNKLIGAIRVPKAREPIPPPVAAGPYALAFDGKSSYVKVPSFKYAGDTPLTVESWAIFERPANDPAAEVLVGNPDAAGFAIRKWKGASTYSFCLCLKGRAQGVYEMAQEKEPLPRNRLVHVAGVYDGKAEVRFYVNGQLQNRAPAKGVHKPSPMVLTLGANPLANDAFFEHFLGRMQGVRLSKVARYDDNFTPAKRFEPDADTLALYQFDEGKGDVLKDSSGNNHHGQIVGAKWVKAEVPSAPPVWSLDFDGNARVNLPALALNVDEPLTVEVWVTPRVQSSKKDPTVFEVGWIHQGINLGKGKWQIRLLQSDPSRKETYRLFWSDQEYSPGKRTHLAAVWTGKSIHYYVNGQEQKDHDNVLVGKEFNRLPFMGVDFQGQIHQFRVSKAMRYTGRTAPISERFESDDKTLILYRFDEGQGDFLNDASGNKNHGTIVGAKWVKAGEPPPRAVRIAQKFVGHTDKVLSVALSADSKRVLTGSEDTTAILWDADSGKKIQTYLGHTAEVRSVALSADGKLVLTGSKDGNAILWDAASGKILKTFPGNKLYSVALSGDNSRVLTGSWDKTAVLWDVASGAKLKTFAGHTKGLYSVALSADGKFAVSGSEDSTAILWDTASGAKLKTFEGHAIGVTALALSRDGAFLLTGSFDDTAILWEIASGKKIKTFRHNPNVRGVALSSDGARVLTGARDKTAILWEAASGKKLHTFKGHTDGLSSVALSGDGKFVLTGSWDKTAILWEINAAPPQTPPAPAAVLHAIPSADHFWKSGISSDGRLFVAAGDTGSRGTIPIWDLATGTQVKELALGGVPGFFDAQFLPGSKYLVTSHDGAKEINLWDIAAGKVVRKFVGHSMRPGFAISPSGDRILSWADDKTLRLWEVDTGIELRQLKGHTDKAAGVFSPDGTQILTFSHDKTLRLWDVESGKELRKLEGHTDAPIGAFSADGKLALSYAADQTIRLWDLATGKEIRQFGDVLFKPNFAGFVADGRQVVGNIQDKKFRVWDTDTGKLDREIDYSQVGENGWSMTPTPDGRLALVSHIDGSIRVYDLATGQQIHRYDNCPLARAFSFSPDGTLAMAGSFRRGVYVFRLPPPGAKAAAPWQPRLDAKLSHWNQAVANLPDAISVTETEGEPVLRIKTDGKQPQLYSKTHHQNSQLRLEFQMPNKPPAEFAVGYGWTGGKSMLHFFIPENGKPRGTHFGTTTKSAVLERGAIVPIDKVNAKTLKFADVSLAPPGQWNQLDLVRIDDRVAFFINGRFLCAVADLRGLVDGKETELGKAGFNLVGVRGEVWMRRIEIRDIGALPPELLANQRWACPQS